MGDRLLELYQNNKGFRDGNIIACLFIGREGECGEYPAEPFFRVCRIRYYGF